MADLGGWHDLDRRTTPRLLERLADLRVVLFSSGHRLRGAPRTGVGPWWAVRITRALVGSQQKYPKMKLGKITPPQKKNIII